MRAYSNETSLSLGKLSPRKSSLKRSVKKIQILGWERGKFGLVQAMIVTVHFMSLENYFRNQNKPKQRKQTLS
jgi:hypothetical protein